MKIGQILKRRLNSHIYGGYKMIYTPNHPRASNRGYIFEQILIVEKVLGKYLPIEAVVHHHDNNGLNNSNNNLVVCENRIYHKLLHRRQKILNLKGDPNLQKICSNCGLLKSKTEFYSSNTYDKLDNVCKECSKKHRKEYYEENIEKCRTNLRNYYKQKF